MSMLFLRLDPPLGCLFLFLSLRHFYGTNLLSSAKHEKPKQTIGPRETILTANYCSLVQFKHETSSDLNGLLCLPSSAVIPLHDLSRFNSRDRYEISGSVIVCILRTENGLLIIWALNIRWRGNRSYPQLVWTHPQCDFSYMTLRGLFGLKEIHRLPLCSAGSAQLCFYLVMCVMLAVLMAYSHMFL